MSAFRGFYINLDRNQARSASMTQQLADVGMAGRYERFPAVDGRALGAEFVTALDRGALGLWLTHERLLSANRSSDAHLHVMEDDVLLPRDADVCFANVLATADRDFSDWDLIYTDIMLNLDFGLFELIKKCKEMHRENGKLKLGSLKSAPFACTSSFFINRKSIDKYLQLDSGTMDRGRSDRHLPAVADHRGAHKRLRDAAVRYIAVCEHE